MGPETASVIEQIDRDLEGSIGRLGELLRIPSVGTDPRYAADTRRAAEWLVAQLEGLGMEASLRATEGQPMVVAHDRSAPPGHPISSITATTTSSPGPPRAVGDGTLRAHHRRGSARSSHRRPRCRGRQGPADDLARGVPQLESRARHIARPGQRLHRGRGGERQQEHGAVPRGQPRGAVGRSLRRVGHRHAGRRQPGHHLHAARARLCRGDPRRPQPRCPFRALRRRDRQPDQRAAAACWPACTTPTAASRYRASTTTSARSARRRRLPGGRSTSTSRPSSRAPG